VLLNTSRTISTIIGMAPTDYCHRGLHTLKPLSLKFTVIYRGPLWLNHTILLPTLVRIHYRYDSNSTRDWFNEALENSDYIQRPIIDLFWGTIMSFQWTTKKNHDNTQYNRFQCPESNPGSLHTNQHSQLFDYDVCHSSLPAACTQD
jgi:hypothetical protein